MGLDSGLDLRPSQSSRRLRGSSERGEEGLRAAVDGGKNERNGEKVGTGLIFMREEVTKYHRFCILFTRQPLGFSAKLRG